MLRLCLFGIRLELPPLGQLQKLLIGHNNQGQTPTWHLALVEVVDEDSGHTTYFAADRSGGLSYSAVLVGMRTVHDEPVNVAADRLVQCKSCSSLMF